jgi:hypothetical protein
MTLDPARVVAGVTKVVAEVVVAVVAEVVVAVVVNTVVAGA